ncbi:TetR/AcrR family transcriptional regulator [Caloranaerobacter azorensis]|uniref:TetR/AcrR family transcriptional regulator n=1 Tax=Caloranaerobacter azorensis TaxID=116090 RepID=A0A6P1YCC4_9FIRM|nr:TetR/AcrR family transcriptional regulator [Caloranaerobacter azorensis]QIB26851.1 TetR/AcrR family transcriptional regulator [Caloranaerobacter azorensis]
MPKQTFLNLPEDKKKKIIDAARKEFSRVPIYDASISNIIKNANIPRGSFYQYFENKEDIFFLVLKDFRDMNQRKFKKFLIDTNGDLIKAFILLYEYLLQFLTNEEDKNFFKNAFLNMNHRIEQNIAPWFRNNNKRKYLDELLKLIDLSKLNITELDDVCIIFRILTKLTMSNIVESLAKKLSFDESMQLYKKQIELIKNGIYKN